MGSVNPYPRLCSMSGFFRGAQSRSPVSPSCPFVNGFKASRGGADTPYELKDLAINILIGRALLMLLAPGAWIMTRQNYRDWRFIALGRRFLWSVNLLLLGGLWAASTAYSQPPTGDPQNGAVATVSASAQGTPVKLNASRYARLVNRIATQGRVRIIIGMTPTDTPSVRGDRNLSAYKIGEMQSRLLAQLAGRSISVQKRFRHIPYLAMEVDGAALQRLMELPDVSTVREDQLLYPQLEQSIPLIGADTAWGQGYTGNGQVIAVLDTGVDKFHSFLNGKVVAEACFSTTSTAAGTTSLCPNGTDTQTGDGAGVNCVYSGCDHGTHVAGIAAGTGGVAKDADVLAIQVFSRNSDNQLTAFFSDILAALDYVYDQRANFSIAAVNMSLGGGGYGNFLLCDQQAPSIKAAIDQLRSAGIATVIAAGNLGRKSELSIPGCLSNAVSVGASQDNDTVASFSNSASWLSLLAPGVGIRSSVPNGQFGSKSGTSMAAPHVAGAIAVLKSQNPTASVDEVLAALTLTGQSLTDSRNGFVQARLDVGEAVTAAASQPLVNQILDQDYQGAAIQGSFTSLASPGAYGGRALQGVSSNSAYRFEMTPPVTNRYRVSAWWPNDSASSSEVEFTLTQAATTLTTVLDQRSRGGQWNAVGEMNLQAGQAVSVTVAARDGANFYADALRIESVTANPDPLVIETQSLEDGMVDSSYLQNLQGQGGVLPYTWAIVGSGSLPPGLILAASPAAIEGTPTTPGSYDFTLQLTDSLGASVTQPMSLQVLAASTNDTAQLLITADNGEEVYLNGVSLGSSGSWWVGTSYDLALQEGVNVVAVKGIDAGGVAGLLAELTVEGQAMGSDGGWKVSTQEQAGWQGLGFDDSGWVAARDYGAYGIAPWYQRVQGFGTDTPARWIWSADSNQDNTVYFRYTFVVGPAAPPLAIDTLTLPNGELGQAYQASLLAQGGFEPYHWRIASGTLPLGLSLETDTGRISGQPTQAGTAALTIEVQDAAGATVSRAYQIEVTDAVSLQGQLLITADNGEEVYLNGVSLGSSGSWWVGTSYDLALQEGVNVVAVKGIDAGGVAGLLAELTVEGQAMGSDGGWKVSTQEQAGWQGLGFDDSGWVAARDYGAYGIAPWYQRVQGFGTDTPARWIWSADNNQDNTVYFRYTFVVGQ